jgi:hypothetical protein
VAGICLAAQLPDGSLYLYRDTHLSGTAGFRLLVGYGVGGSDAAAQADRPNRSTYGEALTLR